jgi:hypothetical protein
MQDKMCMENTTLLHKEFHLLEKILHAVYFNLNYALQIPEKEILFLILVYYTLQRNRELLDGRWDKNDEDTYHFLSDLWIREILHDPDDLQRNVIIQDMTLLLFNERAIRFLGISISRTRTISC